MSFTNQSIEAARELECCSHFRTELVECSLDGIIPEKLREMFDDMIRSKVALKDGMREHFAIFTGEEQILLLD